MAVCRMNGTGFGSKYVVNEFLISGICDDADVNKDAIFVDKLAKLVEDKEDTTTLFMPTKLSLQALLTRARRDVKHRIKRSLPKKPDTDDAMAVPAMVCISHGSNPILISFEF